MAKSKPVVFGKTEDDSMGRHIEEMSEKDVPQAVKLGSYIPGYTETVMANDMAKGERFASGGEIHGPTEKDKRDFYESIGQGPEQRPFVFRWVRTSDTRGETTQSIDDTLWGLQRRGWRPAKADDFREGGKFYKLGWRKPPAAQDQGNGTLRRRDTTLYYMKGDRYRKMQADNRTPEEEKLPRGPDSRMYEEREGESKLVDSAGGRSV